MVEWSLVIPVPSCGLKLIERVVRYDRRMPETGGKWSMATYIEALETHDPVEAKDPIGDIVLYNEEDLDARWAVYEWLRGGNGYQRASVERSNPRWPFRRATQSRIAPSTDTLSRT